MKNTKSMHITPAGGNVFADLGFEPKEAAILLAETDRVISEKLKQAEAAEILGGTHPAVVIPENERWLHEPSVKEALARADKWMSNNSVKEADLDALEANIKCR
jgi:hypothetical protein